MERRTKEGNGRKIVKKEVVKRKIAGMLESKEKLRKARKRKRK